MNAQRTEILPSLFGPRGEFCPLADSDCMKLSGEALAIYDDIADAYTAVAVAEKNIESTERELRAAVVELRATEQERAAWPKLTQVDLARTLARQTAGL